MHTRLTRALTACALLAAVGCAGPTPDSQQSPAAQGAGGTPPESVSVTGPADVILSNGKVITVDDKFTIAQAVAIKGERVIAVGTTEEIADWRVRRRGPST